MKLLIISNNVNLRSRLSAALMQTSALRPTAQCCDTGAAKQNMTSFSPDAVIVDLDFEGALDPVEFIKGLAPRYSVPIIVFTANNIPHSQLIGAGAVDVIVRKNDIDRFISRISASLSNVSSTGILKKNTAAKASRGKLIAVGGSTGSTSALPVILKDIPVESPPIVCVLHMPEGYTKIYADQLNSTLPLNVVEAKSGMYLKNGDVVIAAGKRHLRVFRDNKGYFITSERGVPVTGHCPSVDALFSSVAVSAKEDAVGVILTGMGKDGARGMLSMKNAGAYTIAQDEASCVVYGMPKAAVDDGAAIISCPLTDIAKKIKLRMI